MKISFLLTITLVGFQALAASPNGMYYAPSKNLQDGYSPERFTVISNDKMIDYSIFNDAKIAETYTISTQDNTITVTLLDAPEGSYDCNGKKVTFNKNLYSTMSAEFERLPGSLVLTTANNKLVFTDATTEEISRVQSLPDCIKK